MPDRPIRRDLDALFAEHETPTHQSCRACHDTIKPTADLVLATQKQIAEYRSVLTTFELSEHDRALDGKMEMLHQTLTAMERDASALYASVRQLAKVTAQWDRVMAEARIDVTRWRAGQDAKEFTAHG